MSSSVEERCLREHASLIRYLVRRIAIRLPSHVDLDDLFDSGAKGLMKALKEGGADGFKARAERRIKEALLEGLREIGGVQGDVWRRGRRASGDSRDFGLGGSIDPEETLAAVAIGLPMDRFRELVQRLRELSAANPEEIRESRPPSDERRCRARAAADRPVAASSACPSAIEIVPRLVRTLARLSDEQRLVFDLHYREDLNAKEIGAILGVADSQVEALQAEIWLRLRDSVQRAENG